MSKEKDPKAIRTDRDPYDNADESFFEDMRTEEFVRDTKTYDKFRLDDSGEAVLVDSFDSKWEADNLKLPRYECPDCQDVFNRDVKICQSCDKPVVFKGYEKVYEEFVGLDNFGKPELLDLIKDEISKDHLGDDDLKISLFLTYVSALLPNPKLRQSFQITGRTSEGKDNVQKSCLKHLPRESFLFITSGTQATFEDDIKDYPIIAISELNLFREGGANKHLLEAVKQRIEGGTHAIKKDVRKNNKEVRMEKGDQASVTFGTTDAQQDEELGTRLMKGTIQSTSYKIKKVNDNTFSTFSDEKLLLKKNIENDSWVRIGLNNLWKSEDKFQIVVPYAKYLAGEIDGSPIIDHSDPRSQRDVKRLLSLTCACAFLYQKQRQIKEVEGVKFIVSEPQDLIKTLKASNRFFNQTYSGMDSRIGEALKFIEKKGDWVDKLDVQEHLKIKTRDTINSYLWDLEQKAFIERRKGVDLNSTLMTNSYKGNHIYYRSVQKASNKRLVSVDLERLEKYLEEQVSKISVEFEEKEEELVKNDENKREIIIKGEKKSKHLESKDEIRRFELDASGEKYPEFSAEEVFE